MIILQSRLDYGDSFPISLTLIKHIRLDDMQEEMYMPLYAFHIVFDIEGQIVPTRWVYVDKETRQEELDELRKILPDKVLI